MRYTFWIPLCLSTVAAAPVMSQSAPAPSDTATTVTFGGFVDTYYAYDFSRPENLDRAFTTQPARHNEFNVNLAFIEARVAGPRIRGRLALQAGTSVQSNYAGEPTLGSVSGPSLSRHLQEAVAGYHISPSLWIDGGIMLSHIGMESFISRDNLTYTRSLSADYTPYYASGAKLTWHQSSRFTAALALMNGWQNISENNVDKAVGLRLDFARTTATTISYYSHFGKENSSRSLRIFNGVGMKTTAIPGLTLQINGDYGIQEKEDGGDSRWYSGALIGKVQPTPQVGMSGRIEAYRDPDQVIIVTGTDAGFKGTTASFGVDISPLGSNRAMWRNEVRGSWTSDPVFPSRSTSGYSNDNYLLVTSMALTF